MHTGPDEEPGALEARANHLLRVVAPDDIAPCAALHDDEVWNTLCSLLHVDLKDPEVEDARDLGTLPMRLGGLGLRDARRTSPAAQRPPSPARDAPPPLAATRPPPARADDDGDDGWVTLARS